MPPAGNEPCVRFRVIVAQDHRVLQDVMRFNLARAGFDVRTASDGSVVMKLLTEFGADLLITGCQMPGMDGLELCRRLRNHPWYFNLPILLCSAKGFEIGQETLDDLQLPAILCKPFSPSDLIRKARELIESRRPGVVSEAHPPTAVGLA